MNIATNIYSEEYLLKHLLASNRTVWYEYTVSDKNNKTLGLLNIESGVVSFDSTAEVMRTFNGSVKNSDLLNINTVDERIVPWMCLRLPDKNVVKWPLGRFLVNPAEDGQNGSRMVTITGYDLGKIALDDKAENRTLVEAGMIYTSAVAQLLGTIYSNLNIEASAKTKTFSQEWEIGTRKLEIVNTLLSGINYNPLHFDEYGKGIVDAFVFPESKSVEITYSANDRSIILDGFSKRSNKFEVPNKFVRYTENVDSEYLISVYTNDSSNNPYSTVSRGRVISDVASVNNIATQTDLDAYTRRIALSAMQSTESLEFSTLNMPGHGFKNCLHVKCDMYGVDDKYIETGWEMELVNGGTMKHKCERVISV